jgi:hypothetical protein
MERQTKTLGEILVGLGRIAPDQVDAALAHQREHGGYFGDALVHLGFVSRAELKWTLADQFNLPFVHIKPENIDRATAAMVPAAWARHHLVLPVLRSGGTVTVVLDNPGDLERLDEVARFTGAETTEAALASPENIRELIDAVHGAGHGPPIPLERLIEEALGAEASAFGVSVRPGRVAGWYRAGKTRQRPLGEAWETEMDAVLSPLSPLPLSPVHGVRRWPAILSTARGSWRVTCHALGRGDALEFSADLEARVPASSSVAPVEGDALAAITARLDAGGATLRVLTPRAGDEGDAGGETLEATFPTLPAALRGADVRSLHLSDRPVAVAPALLYLMVRGSVVEALEGVEAFSLEALTMDLERVTEYELEAARRVAPLVGFHSRADTDPGLDADFDLRLRVRGDGLAWDTYPATD